MKLKYKISKRDDDCNLWKSGDIKEIKTIETDFCCDKMKEAFEDSFIEFGEYPSDSILNCDSNVNIYKCSPYPEGACWDEMAISFCPFCGKKIEISEAE